jgi:hypothetical protein
MTISEEILVNITPQETRVAIVENERLGVKRVPDHGILAISRDVTLGHARA